VGWPWRRTARSPCRGSRAQTALCARSVSWSGRRRAQRAGSAATAAAARIQRQGHVSLGGRMRLTPREMERLLIFTTAELARKHRAKGLKLNYPEAVALLCHEIIEGA